MVTLNPFCTGFEHYTSARWSGSQVFSKNAVGDGELPSGVIGLGSVDLQPFWIWIEFENQQFSFCGVLIPIKFEMKGSLPEFGCYRCAFFHVI